MEEKIKYAKSQATFTIFFDSDFEPSIVSKILGVNAKKIVLKKNADITPKNPRGLGYFQLATNVGDDKFTEQAVTTILRPFIKKVDDINKIVNDNNGYCQLDLYVKIGKGENIPDITLTKNALKLLSSLNAVYKVNLV